MNKWFGKIGFVMTVQDENRPSKWIETVTEKEFYGDILRNYHRWETGIVINDDMNISNQISILADDFTMINLQYMKYIEFSGAFWKINSIDKSQTPRLILGIGGVWNGKTAKS